MTKKSITKAKEIEMLETLFNSDSYFSEEFEEGDDELMRKNIESDFPLFQGTAVGAWKDRAEECEDEYRQIEAELKAKDSTIEALQNSLDDATNRITRLINLLVSGNDYTVELSRSELIEAKLRHDEPLTDEEKVYVFGRL